MQTHDKRVTLINPDEGDLARIDTTDIACEGRAGDVAADEGEVDDLLDVVNRYFKLKLTSDDVLETYSGVRPLFDNGKGNPSAVTRDYVFDLDETGGAPLLSVFGGKITTYRELAERVMHGIAKVFSGLKGDGAHDAALPGGDMPGAEYERFRQQVKLDHPWEPEPLRQYDGRRYGTLIARIAGEPNSLDGLGRHFGGSHYEAKMRYLIAQEWAKTPEDILWRRTKYRLHLTDAEQAAFADWFETAHEKAA